MTIIITTIKQVSSIRKIGWN